MGQCTTCGQWNSLQEAVESRSVAQRERPRLAAGLTLRKVGDIELEEYPRLKAGVSEWDRVLGGGIVPGSVVLVGGDPGVGKSTLLLQVADAVARGAAPPGRQGSGAVDRDRVWYISGEESLPQIGLRARRLGLDPNAVSLSSATDVHSIIEAADENPPEVLIVDSIQSVYDPAIDSTPGSVTQLRECTLRLHQFAKERHVAVLLVGHVTKEGVIAGPKTLEHMVDAVLYLEGERLQAYRLLRSVKNRFGATSEVGVFEMQDRGLAEVPNPSAAFLSDRVEGGSGSAIVVTLEGTRPMLVEVQALVTRTSLAMPRRMTSGIDFNRVVLLAAVLTKRGNVPFNTFDIHVNVVGGLRIEETAADLGTALAMLSSYKDVPIESTTVVIGEVGLAGELRSVGQMELRLQEAAKLGFKRAIVPRRARGAALQGGLEIVEASTLREAAVRVGMG
jgi:DNA repair protein RadA/Sms